MPEPAVESQLDTPPAGRLVIRVKLVSQEEPPPPPPRPRLSKTTLLLIAGAVALLLSWLGISIFRSDTHSQPAPAQAPATAPVATEPTVTKPPVVEAKPVEPEVRQQPDAPPSAVNEVIPDVPKSALDTIRGTIRVSVRVTLDKQGAVVDATAVERGPSRYFQRLSLEASRKWTFTPATSEERRTMLVKFNYSRTGATAQASPSQ